MFERRSPWLGAISLVSMLACSESTSEKAPQTEATDPAKETPDPGKTTAEVVASAPGDAAASGTACSDYEKRLCGQAGPESMTCQSIHQLAEMLPVAACVAADKEFTFTEAKLKTMQSTCTTLFDRLCKDIGPETQTCAMVREQATQMPPERCKEMTEHYDQVLAEVQTMEKRNHPLDAAVSHAIGAGDGPGFGPLDAKVTIVAFSDFQCPYCARAASVATQLNEAYSAKAKFVFRQFPLSFHADAHLAAQASLAAHAQGKFWEYHDLLFAHQSELGRDDLVKYAATAGLDVTKFEAALDGKTYAGVVDDELELGKQAMVDGTPTIFVNGKRVGNATDFAAVAKEVDEALAAAG